jgi:penicillin-binding protein 2
MGLRLAAPKAIPFLTALCVLAVACGGGQDGGGTPTPTPVSSSSSAVAEQFLGLWQDGDYDAMYDLLAPSSQAEISREKFVGRYEAIAEEATITGVSYIFEAASDPTATELPFSVTFQTAFFGDILDVNNMTLVNEAQGWRVLWSPSLIFQALDGVELVHFFPDFPRRGSIFDRNGTPLALDGQLPVVGVVKGLIKDKEALIADLAQRLELPAEKMREKVDADVPSYYFVPLKTLPYGTPPEVLAPFEQIEGVVVRQETQRVYPEGSLAGHTLGYLAEVSEEQLKELGPKGYRSGDLIGAAGLEAHFQDELAGERGGTLAIITPEGTVSHTIAKREATPGKDIHLALDVNVQREAEAALGDRAGSIVVLDPVDNSVLAMASHPTINPNDFVTGLSAEAYAALANDPQQPFFHRAVAATYPSGSTFKPVTMAAGLEKGGYTVDSTFPCPPVWYGLGPDFVKHNWENVDRGLLTLSEGLMHSCNPVFFEVAVRLDGIDPEILPSFASAFGFGKPTGIVGLDEAAGVAPSPEWKQENVGEPWYTGDSVNMSIGQGYLLVTPLQLANMYSALARTGVLRTPLLVKSIVGADGSAQEFEAKELGRLPVSETTLAAIRQGLTLVIASPGGTSYQAFLGSSVAAAGKSGTAEDVALQQHVFFVAYAPRDDARIVALVALDEGQSGSLEAAPMVRRVLETYLAAGG